MGREDAARREDGWGMVKNAVVQGRSAIWVRGRGAKLDSRTR